MTRTFKGTIRTDRVGSECEFEFEFEVEDGATAEDIDAEAKQAAFDCIEWHYTETTGTDDDNQ